MSIWAGEVGEEYDAFKKPYEENVAVFGRRLAEQIEQWKPAPEKQSQFVVTAVDQNSKTITIGVTDE